MKINFRFFLSHVKFTRMYENKMFYWVSFPILLQKCANITYDIIEELWCFRLINYFKALSFKLIYNKAIFHPLNGKYVINIVSMFNDSKQTYHNRICLIKKEYYPVSNYYKYDITFTPQNVSVMTLDPMRTFAVRTASVHVVVTLLG